MKKIGLLFVSLLFLSCSLDNKVDITTETCVKDYFYISTINAKIHGGYFINDAEERDPITHEFIKTYTTIEFLKKTKDTNISLATINARFPYLKVNGISIDMEDIPDGIKATVLTRAQGGKTSVVSEISGSCKIIIDKETEGLDIFFENIDDVEESVKISDIQIY